MIHTFKELRLDIDGLAQLTGKLKSDVSITIFDSGFWRTTSLHGISKEIERTTQSLLLAKAWAGKALGIIGEPSPYQNDGNRKEVKDIEPTDAKQSVFKDDDISRTTWKEYTHIEKVDWLREEIQKLINDLPDYTIWTELWLQENVFSKCDTMSKEDYDTFEDEAISQMPEWSLQLSIIFQHLTEARIHLGLELQRMRENG